MKIYTHVNPDLDAVFSVAVLQYLKPEYKTAEIVLVGANWDGAELAEGDMALDIPAGGKGFKGHKDPATGRVSSAFAGVIELYGDANAKKYFQSVINYIEYIDSRGIIGYAMHMVGTDREKISEFLTIPTLGVVLNTWKVVYGRDDRRVFEKAGEFLEGTYIQEKQDHEFLEKIDQSVQIFAGGKVAYVKEYYSEIVRQHLFKQGVEWTVYEYENNLGVKTNETNPMRADHPDIQKVVEKYGELPEWFAHSAGFLFCRGSSKAPRADKSKVPPMELVEAIVKIENEGK